MKLKPDTHSYMQLCLQKEIKMKPWEGKHFKELIQDRSKFDLQDETPIAWIIEVLKKDWEESKNDK